MEATINDTHEKQSVYKTMYVNDDTITFIYEENTPARFTIVIKWY